MVERLEDEGSELENVLVGVVEPRATREGEDGGGSSYRDSCELDGTRTQESACIVVRTCADVMCCDSLCSGVGELSTCRVEDGSEEDTVLETDVDKERGVELVDGGVENLCDDNGRWRSSQSLQNESSVRIWDEDVALT